MTRRGFLEMQAAMAASMRARVAANDRVQVAFIGCGARAHELMEAMMAHPQFDIVAVSDAYRGRIERAQDRIRERRGAAPRVLKDYREALVDRSVDAVVVA
ncbi:MAG: Gfo/Idh/MocA family oxidoreductase, partial [Bryobacteraceae bacterium]